MPDQRVIDISAEIEAAFDDSSLLGTDQPHWVLLCGGVAAGKSTLRREKYSHGYVTLDAAEIFLRLCHGEYVDFPSKFAEPVDLIGHGIAARAVRERRHIVTELIGARFEPLKQVMDAIIAAGYRCNLVHVQCELAESFRRADGRGRDNISAYYTEPFHQRWILAALARHE